MSKVETQFREELQDLLDRYKNKLTTPQIMRIVQPIFTKTIGFKDNPERLERILNNAVHNLAEDHLNQITSSGPSFLKQHKLDVSKAFHCSAQMIAEADCDGDIKKCGRACLEGEFKCTD